MAKQNQGMINTFLKIDPYMPRTDYFEQKREELNKIKKKDVGINNSRAHAYRDARNREKRDAAKGGGMFGQ